MANTTLTADIIAREAVLILDNELVMGKKVHRGYEKEFDQNINGYKVGAKVDIRKPADFIVRRGRTASNQDVVEGTTNVTVDIQDGVDFKFTSQELTLDIRDLSERVIQPAMVQLANQVDREIMLKYADIPSWVGTPGEVINSFQDYSKGPERADEMANPQNNRCGVLAPADHWGVVGSQTQLYVDTIAKPAYRKGSAGMLGNTDTYMSQNVPTHTVGVATGTPLVNGAGQNVNYSAVKDTGEQTLITDGWTASQTGILKKGDVFTIANVYAVNPVTKEKKPFLRQFTVKSDANSDGTGNATFTISPPIIHSDTPQNNAQQTVDSIPADNAAITVLGTGGGNYRQNMVFHKNAFALTMVPMVSPPGAVEVGRRTYKGINVRVIPYYDGKEDESNWRLDILYGVDTIDNRLCHRLSGSPDA